MGGHTAQGLRVRTGGSGFSRASAHLHGAGDPALRPAGEGQQAFAFLYWGPHSERPLNVREREEEQ